MSEIRGVYPVVATPFTRDGEVDYEELRGILRSQIDRGCHGVILFGIAAEFYKLSDAEQREIVRVATDECERAETNLLVSVTQHATRRAVERARDAVSAGADGLMVLPPFFLGPSEEDVLEHLRRIGAAVDVPVVVQYAPEQTGVTIDPATFERLSEECPTIDYYKIESQPPGPYITQLLEATGGAVDALIGYAGLQMIEAMDRGAVGVIPGSSISDIYLDIYHHYREGSRERAVELHSGLLPLLNLIVQDIEMFIYYEKRLLQKRGLLDDIHPRAPAFEPDDHYDRLFEQYFAELEPHL